MIKYYSPEWKRISQCLVKLGIYGTDKCRKETGAYVIYSCGRKPAIKQKLAGTNQWRSRETSSLAIRAILILQEKHPEYEWHREADSIIIGVLR